MTFIEWIISKLGGSTPLNPTADTIEEYMNLVGEVCFRELAYASAKSMIANSLSKCEFRTMYRGKEERGREWYLWNVEPNKNENSSRFIRKIVNRLCDNNECLVIEQGGQLLVADSFAKKDYTLYDDTFTQVRVGDFTFSQTFAQSDVLYWKLSDKNIRHVLDTLNGSYAKLLAYGMKNYQLSRGRKAKLKYETLPPHVKAENANQWLEEQIKKYQTFLTADNGVVTEGKGLSLEAYGGSTTYSNENTRDIRAMVGDILDFTALGLGIPPALLRGDVQGTSDAMDNLLTICIDPWADFLREEIVRKRIGRDEHLRGTDLIVDVSQVKHIDIMSASGSIDKLIGSGVFCVNDILKLLGRPIIDEPWAWAHYITRNYMLFEEALKALKGGENG